MQWANFAVMHNEKRHAILHYATPTRALAKQLIDDIEDAILNYESIHEAAERLDLPQREFLRPEVQLNKSQVAIAHIADLHGELKPQFKKASEQGGEFQY